MATAVALALQDLMQMASKVEPLDPAVIQRTRDTLGKIIAKPPLTDKLLSRPPFRYLHDIVTEVMRTTGFLDGLYSAEELNVNNIQDKEQKMKFLQKAVDAVSKFVSCAAQLCFSERPVSVVGMVASMHHACELYCVCTYIHAYMCMNGCTGVHVLVCMTWCSTMLLLPRSVYNWRVFKGEGI